VLLLPGGCPVVLGPQLAHVVNAYLDGFPVEHPVAAVGALPQAGGAQLDRGGRFCVPRPARYWSGTSPGWPQDAEWEVARMWSL
jgi:hypothetical protein